MQENSLFHNSHDEAFRKPFGAVCCGSAISLKLRVRGQLPDDVNLRVWREGIGETYFPMELVCHEADSCYCVNITVPETPGLLWYCFQVIRGSHISFYGADPSGLGGIGQEFEQSPVSYQVTVYPAALATPAWFKEAIVYQIFIDRFFNGHADGRVEGLRKGSLIHAFWDDTPFYVRDPRTGHIYSYDFFGGNLAGVIQKLPYLNDLGINAIYLNPIFESPSNHKYDTGDYKKIDPSFGNNDLFKELCREASKYGIRIILDGVFSHTGSDSIYFNKEGTYPNLGAFQSTASPYYNWYRFEQHPDKYDSWWGIGTLPNVNELEPSYLDYIIHSQDSVINHWFNHGCAGWRLDVADELPDLFIQKLRRAMKQRDPDSILIGEVWEDASRKQSYGVTRQYLLGDELDSIMNYPFRNILLDFILGRSGASDTRRKLTSLFENYPREIFYSTLNIVGSHDVPRILTLLGEAPSPDGMTIIEQAKYRLSEAQRYLAMKRLRLIVLWQMTFPGAPCIYYGDEVGLEGYTDPFNRGTYPWGHENQEILAWYQKLTALRQHHAVLRTGEWVNLDTGENVYAYLRRISSGRDVFGNNRQNNTAVVLINRSDEWQPVSLDLSGLCREFIFDLLDEQCLPLTNNRLNITLEPYAGKLLLQSLSKTCQMERSSGILLHPTSLPSPYGIGDLGPGARAFVDWLAASGQTAWQILPLTPPGYGNSPYQCYSAFAGNVLLISPDELVNEGLLDKDDLRETPRFSDQRVLFEPVKKWKESLFYQAFFRFSRSGDSSGFQAFRQENAEWLEDYALFMALKNHFQGAGWQQWPADIASYDKQAVHRYREHLAGDITYHCFLQYLFWRQWQKLKTYANKAGIKVIGDVPIFVSYDSCDVWANRRLFQLDFEGRTVAVAGVPPDYFSETGQLWGNPLYNWQAMAEENYHWWQQRMKQMFRQADWVRIDHFRGFDEYWQIPAGQDNAINGVWTAGPGADFFAALEKQFGSLPVIAEDLGIITPSVELLRDMFQFPGMQVLQFMFESECLSVHQENTIVYTGTHDNDTTVGWINKSRPEIKAYLAQTLRMREDDKSGDLCWKLIDYSMSLPAKLAITPLQDILRLGSEARMNIPGTVGENWSWRCEEKDLTEELAHKFFQMTQKHRR